MTLPRSHPRCSQLLPGVPLFMVLALLTGCTVGPNYHRPAVPLPPAFPTQLAGAPGSLGDQQWWKVFRDPALQDLIRRALANNPDITVAAGRVALVRAQTEALQAAYRPEVGALTNETLQRISPIGLPKDRTTGDPAGSATIFGAQASWEIDFWGKYRRAHEAERATLLASQAAQQAVLASLVSDVASAYFDLLSLDEQCWLMQQQIALDANALDLTQARERQGVSTMQEVRQSEAQLADTRKQLEPLQRRIQEREADVRALLGETSGSVPRGETLWTEAIPDLGPGIPSELLQRRPDIREAEQNLVAANAEIGIAEAAYFPNLTLTAGGGQESTAFHNLLTSNADTWLLQPQLNVPIFTAGRIRAGVQQARAQDLQLVGRFRATVISAFRDVAVALALEQSAHALALQQDQVVRDDTDAAGLVHRRLDQGVSSSLDVIAADQATLSAQRFRILYRGDVLLSTVRLYGALGGGWQP